VLITSCVLPFSSMCARLLTIASGTAVHDVTCLLPSLRTRISGIGVHNSSHTTSLLFALFLKDKSLSELLAKLQYI